MSRQMLEEKKAFIKKDLSKIVLNATQNKCPFFFFVKNSDFHSGSKHFCPQNNLNRSKLMSNSSCLWVCHNHNKVLNQHIAYFSFILNY